MASNFDNPAAWRLHNNNGTVPFKIIGMDGSFEPESGDISLRGLIIASDMIQFLIETFPPAIRVGNLSIPQSAGLPGLPAMTARKVTFKNFDDGKPIDPFGFDTSAPSGTYNKVVEVTVEYGLNKLQQPDPTNPFTFLELSGNTTGEFIHTTAPGAKWQRKRQKPGEKPDADKPGGSNVPREAAENTTKEAVRDPTIPINIVVPQTEWTVSWPQVPFDYFDQVLIYRLRWCLGRVNSNLFPFLHNAEPETILFAGWTYKQQFTWRDGFIGTPPINLELKFIEKRVVWDAIVCGHNHFWRPGKGWEYLLIDGISRPSYELRDMSVLFEV